MLKVGQERENRAVSDLTADSIAVVLCLAPGAVVLCVRQLAYMRTGNFGAGALRVRYPKAV